MNRLIPAALLSLSLAGCATTSTPPSQVATDLAGVLTMIGSVEKSIISQAPNALTLSQQNQINVDIAEAKIGLMNLQNNATAASGVEGYLNDAEALINTIVSDVPGLSAYVLEVEAAEAILNQYLPGLTSLTAARARMSVAQARTVLGIGVVR